MSVSHPVWVRGLKHQEHKFRWMFPVAPRVGAWIETHNIRHHQSHDKVAPRVGAWIETISGARQAVKNRVAPRVGAWIETSQGSN